MIVRLLLTTILFSVPRPAHADPVVFDKDGISFFILAAVITGSLAWWRHNCGDRLATVALWTVAVIAGLMLSRYGANDTWRFVISMAGA